MLSTIWLNLQKLKCVTYCILILIEKKKLSIHEIWHDWTRPSPFLTRKKIFFYKFWVVDSGTSSYCHSYDLHRCGVYCRSGTSKIYMFLRNTYFWQCFSCKVCYMLKERRYKLFYVYVKNKILYKCMLVSSCTFNVKFFPKIFGEYLCLIFNRSCWTFC